MGLQLEMAGDRRAMLGGPPISFPACLIPAWDREATACWYRVVYLNGRNRWFPWEVTRPFSQGRIADLMLRFDQTLTVGMLLALTDQCFHRPKEAYNVIGLARLMSVAGGPSCIDDGEQYVIQRWQTLRMICDG